MFKKKKQLLIYFICGLTLLFFNGVKVNAYVKNGYVLSNPKGVKYAISTTASQYTAIIRQYATTWDSYCSEIGMSMGTGENIYFYGDLAVDNGTYAVTHHSRNDYHSITFYKSFTSASPAQKNETIAHETGHALGLAHCQTEKNSVSVMRKSGFNNKAYPLSDDKKGISDIY